MLVSRMSVSLGFNSWYFYVKDFPLTWGVGPFHSWNPYIRIPNLSPRDRIEGYYWKYDFRNAFRQGRLSPALRFLSVLLDIVVQLLIIGYSGIGQPSMAVAAARPRIPQQKGLIHARKSRKFSAHDSQAASMTLRVPSRYSRAEGTSSWR